GLAMVDVRDDGDVANAHDEKKSFLAVPGRPGISGLRESPALYHSPGRIARWPSLLLARGRARRAQPCCARLKIIHLAECPTREKPHAARGVYSE
ncbi:MAG: hypothetical protein KC488_00645, partial [Candidatus Cloacimonetes bacterium]|nr:hypothetical protein [Candidatus Cloacimonadota bacterium]